jgi:hypothetical protein
MERGNIAKAIPNSNRSRSPVLRKAKRKTNTENTEERRNTEDRLLGSKRAETKSKCTSKALETPFSPYPILAIVSNVTILILFMPLLFS